MLRVWGTDRSARPEPAEANASGASRPAFPRQEASQWKKQACNVNQATESRVEHRRSGMLELWFVGGGSSAATLPKWTRGRPPWSRVASKDGCSSAGCGTLFTRSPLGRREVSRSVRALPGRVPSCPPGASAARLWHSKRISRVKYARNSLNKEDGRSAFSFFCWHFRDRFRWA